MARVASFIRTNGSFALAKQGLVICSLRFTPYKAATRLFVDVQVTLLTPGTPDGDPLVAPPPAVRDKVSRELYPVIVSRRQPLSSGLIHGYGQC